MSRAYAVAARPKRRSTPSGCSPRWRRSRLSRHTVAELSVRYEALPGSAPAPGQSLRPAPIALAPMEDVKPAIALADRQLTSARAPPHRLRPPGRGGMPGCARADSLTFRGPLTSITPRLSGPTGLVAGTRAGKTALRRKTGHLPGRENRP